MIITVTLNPCIDRTIQVNGFMVGRTNRITASRCDVSGKGINVSIALRNLGEKTLCVGFNYRENGELLPSTLRRLGIESNFVEVNGRMRTNIKIFDTKTRVMSELNEPGIEVSSESLQVLKKILEQYLPITSLLILDGSTPPGVPTDYYRTIAEKANKYSVKTVIDARGELLREGIKAHPYLIKPNLEEMEETFGEKITTKKDAIRIARKAINEGVNIVCVSLGKDGALLVTENEAYYSPGINIQVQGVQGAGDSMVAGMSYAMTRKMPLSEILRYGVAVAHGSLVLEGTQMCSREGFKNMLPRITVERINENI